MSIVRTSDAEARRGPSVVFALRSSGGSSFVPVSVVPGDVSGDVCDEVCDGASTGAGGAGFGGVERNIDNVDGPV